MTFLFVSRPKFADPIAHSALQVLRGQEENPLETSVIPGGSSEVPERSVVFIGCSDPKEELWHPWYARVLDMRHALHRSMVSPQLWLAKASFVVVVRKWSTSERRFKQSVRRLPGIIERMEDNGLRAA